MRFSYEREQMYRMPPHFGPSPGPRQNPADFTPDHQNYSKRHTATVSYLTRKEQIEEIIPPRFSVWGEPVIHIDTVFLTEIEWLAGRSYALSGVRTPLCYDGRTRKVYGMFQLVLWENLADPIITGREEIGAPKLFGDIPPPRVLQNRHHYETSWQGHTFLDMELADLEEAELNPPPLEIDGVKSEGVIYYKYIPRTFIAGKPDVEYATLSPAAGNQSSNEKRLIGKGTARFIRSTFEQLPTMFHIINRLSELDLVEFRGASITISRGGRDYKDTNIIE